MSWRLDVNGHYSVWRRVIQYSESQLLQDFDSVDDARKAVISIIAATVIECKDALAALDDNKYEVVSTWEVTQERNFYDNMFMYGVSARVKWIGSEEAKTIEESKYLKIHNRANTKMLVKH